MRLTFERGRHVKMEQTSENKVVHGLKADQETDGAKSGDEPDYRAAKRCASDSRCCPESGKTLEALP